MIRLVTTAELRMFENVLATDGLPNTLRVRDPTRFPELIPMVDALLERDLPNGHLYAYLGIRFDDALRAGMWGFLSGGEAGDLTRELLAKIQAAALSDLWLAKAERHLPPSEFPLRERLFIAWLNEQLPVEVLVHSPPKHGRLIESRRLFKDGVNAETRRLFRKKA